MNVNSYVINAPFYFSFYKLNAGVTSQSEDEGKQY